jgi:YVTN family beta-propeller protein
MKKNKLHRGRPEGKSRLRSFTLALVTVLSSVSNGLTQESTGSHLTTNTGLPVNQLVATVQLGFNVYPSAVVVSPDSKTIYVTSSGPSGGILSIIDTQTNTVTETMPVPDSPDSLVISPDGSTLYVGNIGTVTPPSHSSLTVISTATKTVTATIRMPGPDDIAITPNGKKLYLTDTIRKAISIIDTATNRFLRDAINAGGRL